MSRKSPATPESTAMTSTTAITTAAVEPPATPTVRGRGTRDRLAASRAGLALTAAAAADLLEEGDRAHAGIPSDARDLLLTEVTPDPSQPRRHFDKAELGLLADDIGRRGVLQPILVRPPIEPGGPYRLVAGERRWRAAQMAGKVRIPARVREMSDEEVRAAQLVENVLRAGLTDIEKGRALRALYELRKGQNYRATWEDVAGEVGLGRARIHDLFHLADLPDDVAELIASGRLSGSHGVALQRAQAQLGVERIGQLARGAARPAARRGGTFAMSVARLRAEIQSALAPPAADSDGSGTAPALSARAGSANSGAVLGRSAAATAAEDGAVSAPLRPFLRRTLEELRAGRLTPPEREMLARALANAPEAETAPSAPSDTKTAKTAKPDTKTGRGGP